MIENICSYGCNQPAITIFNNGKYCCSISYNQCPEARNKNSKAQEKHLYKNRLLLKELNKRAKKCQYCDSEKRISNISQHENTCKKNPKNIFELICEQCYNVHFGEFGSGRFCSSFCAHSFTGSQNRAQKNQKISKKLKGRNDYIHNKYLQLLEKKCLYCGNLFTTKNVDKLYCSRSCSGHGRIFDSEKLSKAQLKAYADGTQRVGGGKTKWYKYGDVKVQGTYELRMCKILDILERIGEIDFWVAHQDRIKYIGTDNKEHTYIIDFTVFEGNEKHFIETKGYMKENDYLKIDAVVRTGQAIYLFTFPEIKRLEKELGIVN